MSLTRYVVRAGGWLRLHPRIAIFHSDVSSVHKTGEDVIVRTARRAYKFTFVSTEEADAAFEATLEGNPLEKLANDFYIYE